MKLLISILTFFSLTSCDKDGSSTEPEPPFAVEGKIQIVAGSKTFAVSLFDNSAAKAFKLMLPLTLDMNDFNSNEKVGSLPNSITTTAINPCTIQIGDIMLYGSNRLVLFYETFSTSYTYTRIGKIHDTAGLKAALGSGNVTIKFEIE